MSPGAGANGSTSIWRLGREGSGFVKAHVWRARRKGMRLAVSACEGGFHFLAHPVGGGGRSWNSLWTRSGYTGRESAMVAAEKFADAIARAEGRKCLAITCLQPDAKMGICKLDVDHAGEHVAGWAGNG